MKRMERRLSDLELKVSKLENIVREGEDSKGKSRKLTDVKVETKPDVTVRNEVSKVETSPLKRGISRKESNPETKERKPKTGKLQEAMVGKYIVGGLASLLVFIAAISLVGLVWNSLTPETKLLILGMSGVLLTTLGFVLIQKKKGPIGSIILGTGAGLVFISIISAHMLFGFIGKYTTSLLLSIWSIAFILSYKYIKSFFTIIIAYIGSYVALLLALSSVVTPSDLIMSIIFAVGIVSTLLISSDKWFSNREKIIVHSFGITSLSTIILWGTISQFLPLESANIWTICLVGLGFALYTLVNRLYNLNKKEGFGRNNIFIGVGLGFLTILGIVSANNLSSLSGYLVFTIINATQLILVQTEAEESTTLTSLYAVFMTLGIMFINGSKFYLYMAVSIPAFILFFIGKYKKHNKYNFTIKCLIIFELLSTYFLSSFFASSNKAIYLLYTIPTLVLVTLLMLDDKESKDFTGLKFTKILGFLTYLTLTIYTGYNIIGEFKTSEVILSGEGTALLLSTLLCLGLLGVNYFKDWSVDGFEFIGHNKNDKNDSSSIMLYVVTTIMFLTSLAMIGYSDIWQGALLEILIALTIALMQSISIMKSKEYSFSGFWVGIQSLMLFWVILMSGFNLPFESVIVSLAGLTIASVSIMGGFRLKMKSLRLYGLILTITMTLKFVLVDLNQENSMTRVVALLVGGLISFGISVLYNKLDDRLDD